MELNNLNQTEKEYFLDLVAILIVADLQIEITERKLFLSIALDFGIDEQKANEILELRLTQKDKDLDELINYFNQNSSDYIKKIAFNALVETSYVDGKFYHEEEGIILKIKTGFNISDSEYIGYINKTISGIIKDDVKLESKNNYSDYLISMIKDLIKIRYIDEIILDGKVDEMTEITYFLMSNKDTKEIDVFFELLFELIGDIGYKTFTKESVSKYSKYSSFRKRLMLYKIMDIMYKVCKTTLKLNGSKHDVLKGVMQNPPANKVANNVIMDIVMEIVKQKILTKAILVS